MKHYDIDLKWRSYQLRPPGSPPMDEAFKQMIVGKQKELMSRSMAQFGITINPGPVDVESRPALLAEKYALEHGRGREFHDLAADGYWQRALRIDDPAVIRALLADAGLPDADVAAILASPAYAQQVDADIEQAYSYGLGGVPALVFENRYLISGAQPYPVLERAAQRVLQDQQS